ncbi:hypothetical protein B0H16DRAFT_1580010 [Mycena metata]|uniref:Uncharacterized protein n=1 Tax=Mycena metata TaxID=1033252 RepID=A0AAD7MUV1_9AGAR|nr:hypothetical protein B0H16DRAFT_1580010 [Mycena metata]
MVIKDKAAIDTFVKTILPILKSTSMSVDDKKQRLDFFTWTMDQNDQNVNDIDALIIAFDGISKNVTSFKATFEETMALVKAEMALVGLTLTINTQRANEDIALLREKLDVQMNTAKELRIIARVSFEHLSQAKRADDVEIIEIRNQEIELAAASYASLAQFSETFADGRSTPASTTTH